MAYLYLSDSSQNSITLTVAGLDGSYLYTRNYAWVLYKDGVQYGDAKTSSSAPGATTTSYTFYYLPADTSFYVVCGIWDASWVEKFTELNCNASTDPVPTPEILSYNLTVLNNNKGLILYSFKVSESASWYTLDEGSINLVSGGAISANTNISGTFNLSTFGSHTITLWVGCTSQTISSNKNVTLTTPSVTFTATQSSIGSTTVNLSFTTSTQGSYYSIEEGSTVIASGNINSTNVSTTGTLSFGSHTLKLFVWYGGEPYTYNTVDVNMQQSTQKIYIYATKNNVTKWWPATPYIYATKNNVTKWWPATPYIYKSGSWQ